MTRNLHRYYAALVLTTFAAFAADEVVFREPFTLKLSVDDEHYYEQRFPRTPYVIEGGVYLFKGERIGVTLLVHNGKVSAVRYQPDLSKADAIFELSQGSGSERSPAMMLTIENRTKFTLSIQALMTIPGGKEPAETSILPVGAGLKNFESWPHPIVQLLLHDLQVGI